MRLSVTVTDQRSKPSRYGVGHASEVEDYERVVVTDIQGSGLLMADILRSIADELSGKNQPHSRAFNT